MPSHFFKVLQYLSIDIVIGAVILLRFFSLEAEVSVEWPVYFLLGSAVWLIYSIDHLKDAKKAHTRSRGRYVFHSTNKRTIIFVMLIVLAFSIAILFYVGLDLIHGGLIVAGLCVIYLLIHQKLALAGLKEVYIALTYSTGILLVPIIYSNQFDIGTFLLLFTLAVLNLIMFSWMEREEDEKDGFSSIATKLGYLRTEKLMLPIFSVGLALAFSTLWTKPEVAFYFILSFLLYGIVILNPEWAKEHMRYRTIGDGVFILPILIELF